MLLIRRIRDLLYEQGFTINGARHRLETNSLDAASAADSAGSDAAVAPTRAPGTSLSPAEIRQAIEEIRALLGPAP